MAEAIGRPVTVPLDLTNPSARQMRLAYDSSKYVDVQVQGSYVGRVFTYPTAMTLTPSGTPTGAWSLLRLLTSDVVISYAATDVYGDGVPNLTLEGPYSGGSAGSGPSINLYNNLAPLDSKLWEMYLTGGSGNVLAFRMVNDAVNTIQDWLQVYRSGLTITQILFPLGPIGIGTANARRTLDVLSTAAAQVRLSYTDNSVYADLLLDSSGNVTITPTGTKVTIAASGLAIGTTPATAGALRLPYNDGVNFRNQANGADLNVLALVTVNSVNNILRLANGTSGTNFLGRSGSGAPSTSDIPASFCAVWKDTSGGTVKLYYNDAGSLKSVALV